MKDLQEVFSLFMQGDLKLWPNTAKLHIINVYFKEARSQVLAFIFQKTNWPLFLSTLLVSKKLLQLSNATLVWWIGSKSLYLITVQLQIPCINYFWKMLNFLDS